MIYSVDGLDRVRPINELPPIDAGAPLPLVISDEQRLLLAYRVADSRVAPADVPSIKSPDTQASLVLIEFYLSRAHFWGPPNDETLITHPLATRGLLPYAAFEVENSSWIRQCGLQSSAAHHYVFTFHDATFECIAKSFTVVFREGSSRDVLFEVLNRLS
jgi:hypothetical protein